MLQPEEKNLDERMIKRWSTLKHIIFLVSFSLKDHAER